MVNQTHSPTQTASAVCGGGRKVGQEHSLSLGAEAAYVWMQHRAEWGGTEWDGVSPQTRIISGWNNVSGNKILRVFIVYNGNIL